MVGAVISEKNPPTLHDVKEVTGCKKGHNPFPRAKNGACKVCKREVDLKYRRSSKGRYMLMRRDLKRQIKCKKQRIAELERIIEDDKEIPN